MPKRIEQSRRHGHADPRRTDRVPTVSKPLVEAPPTLQPVGTDTKVERV